VSQTAPLLDQTALLPAQNACCGPDPGLSSLDRVVGTMPWRGDVLNHPARGNEHGSRASPVAEPEQRTRRGRGTPAGSGISLCCGRVILARCGNALGREDQPGGGAEAKLFIPKEDRHHERGLAP